MGLEAGELSLVLNGPLAQIQQAVSSEHIAGSRRLQLSLRLSHTIPVTLFVCHLYIVQICL